MKKLNGPTRLLRARTTSHGCIRFVEEFRSAAANCDNPEDLSNLLEDTVSELGFRHFAMLHHESIAGIRGPLIRFHNYPSGWEVELAQLAHGTVDPVHQASVRQSVGFFWDELPRIFPLRSKQLVILSRARHFGLTDGFTKPINVPGEPSGSCSFASFRKSGPTPAIRHVAELIGGYAFDTARRIFGYARMSARPRLSRREIECLRLVAAGKTDWEIAVILGISPETVHQYVKRARTAYAVASRSQLVSRGLRDAWIAYDDEFNLRSGDEA